MNIINFRARELREEAAEERVERIIRARTVPVTVNVTEAEVREAFEDLLTATNAVRLAQDAMNRAHERYARLSKGVRRG